MQRWSIGHSRSPHGAQSTGSRTMIADSPSGPVAFSLVGPNTVTVGTPSAEAMCIAPESFVRNMVHAAVISMKLLSVVSPAKLRPAAARATCAHNSFSDADPKTATDAPLFRADCAATSANLSGNQRLAEPNA